MRRLHLLDRRRVLGGAKLVDGSTVRRHHVLETMCGRYEELSSVAVTADPSAVTCLNCVHRVEAAETGLADDRVRTLARPRARQRALTQLADRHPTEFAALLATAVEELMPEIREQEENRLRWMAGSRR